MHLSKIDRILADIARTRGIRYDLTHFTDFLASIGNPQNYLPKSIHVAGTNGKGSTVAAIASALRGLGFVVGTYTSPHLNRYTERISIDGTEIPESVLAALLASYGPHGLTEFELLTAAAITYMADQQPDWVIWETGLGGRLDATNVIIPVVSVITKIAYDHMAILGSTLTEIATEKAGIIKPGVPLVTLATQSPAVSTVISTACARQQSPCHFVNPVIEIPPNFQLNSLYQKENIGLAIGAMSVLSTEYGPLELNRWMAGMATATIPGRFERIRHAGRLFILDGAHNPDGIGALMTSLPSGSWTAILGIRATKSAHEMVVTIASRVEALYVCDFSPGDTIPISDYQQWVPSCIPWEIGDAWPAATSIVITGSLYFIAEIRQRMGIYKS